MGEYIEREAATNVACNILLKMNDISTSVMAKALNSIPAADVAPMRHGRWIDKPLIKSFKHTNIPVVECSVCGIDFCDIILCINTAEQR